MRVIDTTTARIAVDLMSWVAANKAPHFLALHFKGTKEQFIMEDAFAHLALDLVIAQADTILSKQAEVRTAPMLYQRCLAVEVHTTQVARHCLAVKGFARNLVA